MTDAQNTYRQDNSGGVVLVILATVFVTLKLTGQIAWSWWWVLSPLWIPFAIGFLIGGVALLLAWWEDKA